MAEFFYIDQVATRTGLTARTLRFWEEKGLLAPPARTDGGLRLYSEADVARIERVRDLKEVLGLSLDVARELLVAEDEMAALREQAHQLPFGADRLPYIGRAIAILEAQIQQIAHREARLAELRQGYEQWLGRLKDRAIELEGIDKK
ncbi:MAG TPA: MerR family transcriptional regulator [Symbiobacteriaceae bacterium]|jgi:DNA-binding transcriptional MerR regulator